MHGRTQVRQVSLTFDDGPDANYTPQVLDLLKKHRVRATFFLLGSKAAKHPELVKRIVREKHTIGNHSYSHPRFPRLSDAQFRAEIEKSQRTLTALAGYAPKLLRPPYGEITERQLLWASEHGYQVVNWNVDSLDWKQLSAVQVSRNILSTVHAGSIILQHSGGGPDQNLSGTVQALPHVIARLRQDGYTIVPLPELLRLRESQ